MSSKWIRSIAIAMVLVFVSAGCGGAGPAIPPDHNVVDVTEILHDATEIFQESAQPSLSPSDADFPIGTFSNNKGWTVTFGPDDTCSASYRDSTLRDWELSVTGQFELHFPKQIIFQSDHCTGDAAKGTYTWSYERAAASGSMELNFVVVGDKCEKRSTIVVDGPWVLVP